MTINNEAEYMAALQEVDQLWEQEESPRLLELFDAIETYDELHYLVEPSTDDFYNRVSKLVEGMDTDLNAPIEGDNLD
jgi:antitoxin component HigA of HigAB toxin-antitoxin module